MHPAAEHAHGPSCEHEPGGEAECAANSWRTSTRQNAQQHGGEAGAGARRMRKKGATSVSSLRLVRWGNPASHEGSSPRVMEPPRRRLSSRVHLRRGASPCAPLRCMKGAVSLLLSPSIPVALINANLGPLPSLDLVLKRQCS